MKLQEALSLFVLGVLAMVLFALALQICSIDQTEPTDHQEVTPQGVPGQDLISD